MNWHSKVGRYTLYEPTVVRLSVGPSVMIELESLKMRISAPAHPSSTGISRVWERDEEKETWRKRDGDRSLEYQDAASLLFILPLRRNSRGAERNQNEYRSTIVYT